jgi:hypothetical protein
VLLLLGVLALAALVFFVTQLSRRRKAQEFGRMSDQWMAEQRSSQQR